MEKKKSILFRLLCITIFFNVWFPKAGLKLKGIPLTIGNVFFAITLFLWFFNSIKTRKMKFTQIHLLILFNILFYTIKFMIIGDFIANIGYIIPLIIYPLIFFIIIDVVDTKEKLKQIIKIICLGFIFLCIYAIAQYFLGIPKIDIPGLTVNLTDYLQFGDAWYLQKNNNNSGVGSKIISTYQNGNLFGVNMLLIYPLVYGFYKENNKTKKGILSLILFILCIFLSLSRACWLGVILFIFWGIVFVHDKATSSLIKKILTIMVCILMIIISFYCFPSIVERFSNTDASNWVSMSGRTEGLKTVFNSISNSNSILAWIIGPAGIIKYIGLAYEMTPLAIFVQVGSIGVVLFYFLILKVFMILDKGDYLDRSVRLAIFIWVIVGCIEGAYWLPPTALNLFMVLGLGICNKLLKRNEVEK